MRNKRKILILTNQLLTTCGVSKHILYFLTEAKKQNEFEFTLLCAGGDAVNKYRNLCREVVVIDFIKHENRTFYNFVKSVLFLIKFHIIYRVPR